MFSNQNCTTFGRTLRNKKKQFLGNLYFIFVSIIVVDKKLVKGRKDILVQKVTLINIFPLTAIALIITLQPVRAGNIESKTRLLSHLDRISNLTERDNKLIAQASELEEEQEIEITITAEKEEENINEVPISITPITEGEIEDSDITNLNGIAGNTPNFSTFSPSRNFTTYSIRGLSNFNFLSRDPVAIYVDDVPYDYTGFIGIDLPDIERVEVLRGPQSTLYGRNAQAGVINIITKPPSNKFGFSSTAGYSNYNNPDLRASVSGPIVNDRLFFRFSGSYEFREGFTKNTFLNTDIDFQSGFTGKAKLLWTPSKKWDISLNASVNDYRDGAQAYVRLEQPDPFKIEQNFDGFSDLSNDTQALKVIYKNDNFNLTSITARRFSDQKFENEVDLSLIDFLTQIAALNSTVLSQEFRLQSPKNTKKFSWLIGGFYESRDFNVDEEGLRFGAASLNPGRNATFARINDNIYAVFARASYKPLEPLTISAGLRYESFNSNLENRKDILTPADGSSAIASNEFNNIEQSGDEIIPSFSLQYRFNPNIIAYTSIAKGYKPPGVNYRGTNLDFLKFEAERGWNYEIGLKTSWLKEKLIVNGAFFDNPIDNFQVPVPGNDGFFRDIANAEVDIAGFELETRAKISKGLTAIAGLGFVDAKLNEFINPLTGDNVSGNTLPYAPDLTYNLALQYRGSSGVFGRVEIQGLGTNFFDDANVFTQNPFALVNARIGYEFKDNYGIYFVANNIFDTQYLTTAANFGSLGNIVSYGPPGTYGFQFRTKF